MQSPLKDAHWITACNLGKNDQPGPAQYIRKSFNLKKKPTYCELFVTALGLYEAEVNGLIVGDQVLAPGWTCYQKRVPFQTYDVTSMLKAGENVLGIILGDGWYSGHLAWLGRQIFGENPCLRAQIVVNYSDGTSEYISTDTNWRHGTGPILENDMLMGETYDARLELVGWSQPGFDDSAWSEAILATPEPLPELSVPIGPPVRRINQLPALSQRDINIEGRRHRLFDFGQNFSGWARIRVDAPRGTKLRFRFGEMLHPNNTLYTENLRGAKCIDTYICKGGGLEVWEPRFTFHGFRYVEADITGLQHNDFLEITGVVLHNDMPITGHFECSNPLLNQLQHNILWGQKSNFLEAPTDCPQRDERLGWTGDAQVFIRTACFNMDVQGFFHKWMQDVRDAQSPKGGIPAVVPDKQFMPTKEDGGPAWSDATLICPWTIYLCYGDRKILEDHYGSMCLYMDYLKNNTCLNHIRSHPDLDTWHGFGDWLALDGGKTLKGLTSKDLIGTAFYAHAAGLMAQIASLLSQMKDADAFGKLREDIVKAFQRRFVTADGLLISGTQTAYVLALHFELLPENLRALAAKELVRDIKNREYHLATGFVGTPYLLEVLEKAGYIDIAYRLLEQETFPSWLFPVKNGATTIWERWDGWTENKGFQDIEMNSFNHYAYGAVGTWMYQTVAGLELDPSEPGYRHIIYRPTPGGTITWAKASLQTPQGNASIHWEIYGQALKVQLRVPQGSYATFRSPEGYSESTGIIQPGIHEIVVSQCKSA